MWRFVLRENIAHLQALIATLNDQRRIGQLRAELQDAELELAELDALSAHAHAAHDTSFSAALTLVLREQVKLGSANFGLIQLLESHSECLHIAAQVNFRTQFLRHFGEVRPGDGSVFGKALADGDGVWVEDVEKAEFFATNLKIAQETGFRAVKSLPLLRSFGQVLGMLSLHYADPQRWSPQDRSNDRAAANSVAHSVLAIRPTI